MSDPIQTNDEILTAAIDAAFQYLQAINDHAQGERWTRVEAYAERLEKAAHTMIVVCGLLGLSQKQDPPTSPPKQRGRRAE